MNNTNSSCKWTFVSSSSSSSLMLLFLLLIGGGGTTTSSSSLFGGGGSCFGPTFVEGWGTLGHEIVANIAWNRLGSSSNNHFDISNNMNKKKKKKKLSKIQYWITNILNNTDNNDNDDDPSLSPLAVVADWADRVRHYKPWSGPLHFIDVRDDLYKYGCHYHHHSHEFSTSNITTTSTSATSKNNEECYFDYERDCPNNVCVAGAIINYTKQLLILHTDDDDTSKHSSEKMQNLLRGNNGDNAAVAPSSSSFSSLDESSSTSWLKTQALRFVVHFIGDIHQPLHSSRKTDKGGNDFHVHVDFISKSKKHNSNVVDNNSAPTSTRNRNYYHRDNLRFTKETTASHHHHHSWNLHSVWDTGIIEVVMERDYNNSRQLFEEDLLNQSYNDNDKYSYYKEHCGIGMNQSCTTLWGQESFQLALQYAYLMPSSSSSDDDTDESEEEDDEEEVRNGSTLTENYYESRLPIVKQQLIAAGIRLATTLEAIYNATHNNNNNNDNIMNEKNNDDEIFVADEEDQQQGQGQPALSILTNLRMGFAM